MKKNIQQEQIVVNTIASLIKTEYLESAKLLLQENKDAKDSIIIRITNNPWRSPKT